MLLKSSSSSSSLGFDSLSDVSITNYVLAISTGCHHCAFLFKRSRVKTSGVFSLTDLLFRELIGSSLRISIFIHLGLGLLLTC